MNGGGGTIINNYGVFIDNQTVGTNRFPLYLDSGTVGQPILSVTNTGVTTHRNSADSTAAFMIQNSAGASLLNADTTNLKISVNGSLDTPFGGLGNFGNLLAFSEEFDNTASGATWAETNVTAPTADTIVAPTGVTTAESLVSTVAGGSDAQTSVTAVGATYTFSIWLKTASGTQAAALRIDGATSGTGTVQTITVGPSWQRFSVTQNTTGFSGNVKVLC